MIPVFDGVSARAVAAMIDRKTYVKKGILKKREILELGYRSQRKAGIKDKAKLNKQL